MPLYLVRWPWLKASLVSARDEEDLLDTLDQVADSEGARWSVYRGPVWVDFDLPATFHIEEKERGVPLRPDEIVMDDVSKVGMGTFELSTPECDHGWEMDEQVTRKAFPGIYRAFSGSKGEPTEGELKAAVTADLRQLVNAEWSRSARDRRSDELGELARFMGAPVRHIEKILRSAGRLPSEKPPKRPGTVKKLGKKRK